jgi:hypothetical protein
MPLSIRERQLLERAESRGVRIDWAALDRRFNLTCTPIVTLGVQTSILVELAKLTNTLLERTCQSLSLRGIVLFPAICDPAVYSLPDSVSHKRKDNAYFVVRGIDFRIWKRARPLRRLALALENYESSIDSIPERHLPAQDRSLLIASLGKAAARIKSRHAAAAKRRAAANAA